MTVHPPRSVHPSHEAWEAADDAAEIRYSLTALGEAVVGESRGRPFEGFGPCGPAGPAGPTERLPSRPNAPVRR